jgi:3-oxoacyl-[acyl-carrier protein] reductase
MKPAQFEGKSVVITGAGRGIARQVAIDFAADGARVAVVDLVPDRAQAVVKEILAVGGAAIPVVCDVRHIGGSTCSSTRPAATRSAARPTR